VEERTQSQIANAREAEVEKRIPARALSEELRRISAEDHPAEILKGLEELGLLALFSPALGPKMNVQGLAKFDKICRLLPDDARWRAARFGTFLYGLTEKLTPKEVQALIKSTEMPKADVAEWQKLEARAKKLESALKAARIRKASQVYQIVSVAAPEDILFTLYHSALKPVQERLRNHFGKYLQQIAEITPEEWAAIPVSPGSPKYAKARDEFIARRLDRRIKKVVEPPPPPPPPVQEAIAGRRGR
jgi:tRNA nucleotidyltransferase/poly(A) polymerase